MTVFILYFLIIFFKCDTDPLNICIEVSSNLLDLGKTNIQANNCSNFKFKHCKIGPLDHHYFDAVTQSQPDLWGTLSTDTTCLKDLVDEFNLVQIKFMF